MANENKRLRILARAYHQIPGLDPTLHTYDFARVLKQDEQVFSRSPRKPLDDKWVSVLKTSGCWIEKPSIIFLKNDGTGTIEVAYAVNLDQKFLILPQETHPFSCSHPQSLCMRACEGEVTYSITAFPG